jgi:hypothetical protein
LQASIGTLPYLPGTAVVHVAAESAFVDEGTGEVVEDIIVERKATM